MIPDAGFWKGRRVLLTGHSGFKGSWAALWLSRLGARTTGVALPPDTEPNLWNLVGKDLLDQEITGDIRDLAIAVDSVQQAKPSIVIHMAAQSLVRRSYERPVETFATNVMGTVNLLEALRTSGDVEAILIVTTDKVYANNGAGREFVESDPLGGEDPYSASKAAAELASASYAASFFREKNARLATARAGNVIGGGDWSADRLVPDILRATEHGGPIHLRNPDSTRPWQHVLEPLSGYFQYIEALARRSNVPPALNFGPPAGSAASVASVTEIMARELGVSTDWTRDERPGPPEMRYLSLDPALAMQSLGWRPRLSCDEAVSWTARWYADWRDGADPAALCRSQIAAYEELK